jgi:hypothetical protein
LLVWGGWVIGIVRVIEMNPEEEGTLVILTQPSQGAIYDHYRSPFDGLVAVHTMRAQVKTGIINIKPAVEARSGTIARVEYQGTDKCRGVVSPPVKNGG